MTNILLIFIKNPRLGYVKTRLARTVGDAEALRIYRILLEKTRQAALEATAIRRLYYSEAVERDDAWSDVFFEKYVQRDGDLGDRMRHAFADSFAAGAARAIIIGSDCPDLDGALIGQAFAALERADWVIGPTPDGGYYLLGMRAFWPEVFQDVAWSTDTVFSTTMDKIRLAGKTVFVLPLRADVDTEDDWARHAGGTR